RGNGNPRREGTRSYQRRGDHNLRTAKIGCRAAVRVSKGELLASDWKGTHWFDREAGRLVSSEWIARYKLCLTLTPAGSKAGQARLDFTMDIVQEVKTRAQVSTDRPQLPKLESY
uniref:hypothetical protein n=1 Tax=Thermogutta sp. TaxID=1962930 RepID=UPI00322014E6